MKGLVESIVRDHSILQRKTTIPALAALKASLRRRSGRKASPEHYRFLDNCILRLVWKPIKYCGDAEEFAEECSGPSSSDMKRSPISLLHFALLEQWPFFVEAEDDGSIENVTVFLAGYLCCSEVIGEDAAILRAVRSRMWKVVAKKSYGSVLEKDLPNGVQDGFYEELQNWSRDVGDATGDAVEKGGSHETGARPSTPDSVFLDSELAEENEDHSGLNQWNTEDVEVAIEDGAVGELLLCLCSKHSEIRNQALINTRILVSKLKVTIF